MYCPESVYKTSIYHVNPRYEYEGNGSNKRCGAPEIHYGAHPRGSKLSLSCIWSKYGETFLFGKYTRKFKRTM